MAVLCLVSQPCPTLCLPGSVRGHSSGEISGVDCHAHLQGIFPTQGLNPGLSHCGRIPYHLACSFFLKRHLSREAEVAPLTPDTPTLT